MAAALTIRSTTNICWYTYFSDTDLVYGRVLAQTVGTAVMRLADARDQIVERNAS